MAYKIALDYQGTFNIIIEDDCSKEEAIAKAIDIFEEKNPGLFVKDTYAEKLGE
jgi:hypothetical protein